MFGTILLLYAPQSTLGLAIVAIMAALVAILRPSNAALLTTSLLVITLMLEGLFRFLANDVVTPYYRPHEVLALDTRYKPSELLVMHVPHGDLLAIDPSLSRDLAVPRTEIFRTDSLGFRNDYDYSGQKLLIVGDSFVAGNGNSQEHTITARLLTQFGVYSYNLGFQAGPFGYSERISWLREHFPRDACVVLLMFEGNDFQSITSLGAAAYTDVPRGLRETAKKYVRFVREPFVLPRVVYGLVTRAQAVIKSRVSERVPNHQRNAADKESRVTLLGTVRGRPIAFLAGYAEVVYRTQYDDFGFLHQNLARARPDTIFFVPDKFRVYGPLLDDPVDGAFPDAQWAHLKRAADDLGIPAFNLTERLLSRSAKLADSGDLTFWPDDTHWNVHGMDVAAEAIIADLADAGVDHCVVAVH
ncbi:MAG: hypothetical protein KF822_05185 [Steroidobacteraceae bacterium]|nr:hypothetical protein [Steroidobacteraceae bacterium]